MLCFRLFRYPVSNRVLILPSLWLSEAGRQSKVVLDSLESVAFRLVYEE